MLVVKMEIASYCFQWDRSKATFSEDDSPLFSIYSIAKTLRKQGDVCVGEVGWAEEKERWGKQRGIPKTDGKVKESSS